MTGRTYHVGGELVPADKAAVSVEDRGFRYGDAAFETLRAYGGSIFAWEAHADRLAQTCETLGFRDAIPPRDELHSRIRETLAANDLAEAYVRLSVTRGRQAGTLTPAPDPDPTVVVVVRPLDRGGLEGAPPWDEPAVLQTVRTRRAPADVLPPGAKTHNYLSGVLARLELRRAATEEFAADEAILRDTQGHVLEGATSNLFLVDDGRLLTPTSDLPLLPGVTRRIVLELARDEDVPIEEGRYGVNAVREADEVFLTNTTWEIRPVSTVDGLDVSVGPLTELLRRRYAERVEASCYD